MLPSEFKQLWEELTAELFIDAFDDFLEDYSILHILVSIVFHSLNSLLHKTRISLIQTIGKMLNLPEEAYDQLENHCLAPIFQEYSLEVFSFSETFYNEVCKHIKEDIINSYKDNNLSIEQWIHSDHLKSFLKALHKLCLYMMLSEPKIELIINTESTHTEFKKSLHHCLDGFPKDGAMCTIIIPSPIREGKAYQGIKSSVVIIKEQCYTKLSEKSNSIR